MARETHGFRCELTRSEEPLIFAEGSPSVAAEVELVPLSASRA